MSTAFDELKGSIGQIGVNFNAFKEANDRRLDEIKRAQEEDRARLEEIEAKRKMPGHAGSGRREDAARKAFDTYLRKNDPAVLEGKDISIAGGESAGSGAVPTVIANEIMGKAVEVSPIIAEVTRSTSRSGDYKRVVNRKGATAGWVSETGTRSATATPSFRTITPTGGELYTYTQASSWALNDMQFDVGQLITDDAGEQFGAELDQAVLFGTGSSQPYGILKNAPVTTADDGDTRDRDTLRYVTGNGSPSEFDADLLITAYFDLSASYRRNAVWLMSSATLATARKLKDMNGQYLWQPSLGAAVDSGDGTLLGKRVVISERMQAAGSGNTSVLVGDFRRGYELVDVGGMAITRDDNITTPGFVKWYIRQRFLGRLINNDAIRAVRA